MRKISIIGLESLPDVRPGDNIAELIVEAAGREGVGIEDGDVIVVAQKIVSKAEGLIVDLKDVKPSEKAIELAKRTGKDARFVELVLRESSHVLKADESTIIVDRGGFVCINAGIDRSNVGGEARFSLLPSDPDESARRIAKDILRLTGKRVFVIVSDTSSRPLRQGQVDFAIGLAGLNPFRDYRGKRDLYGYMLRVKRVAFADELASAAELVIGQGDEGIPVAIIRGVNVEESNSSAKELTISRKLDLFSGAV